MIRPILFIAALCAASGANAQSASDSPLAFFQLGAAERQAQETSEPSASTETTSPARSKPAPRAVGGNAAADVARIADELGVPRALALAVCRVESRCNYGLTGPGGVHGPLQIKHQTARGLGYAGSASELKGYQGAFWGMKHLAAAYRKCGDASGAAKLHQAGLRANCGRSAYSAKVARFM